MISTKERNAVFIALILSCIGVILWPDIMFPVAVVPSTYAVLRVWMEKKDREIERLISERHRKREE